MQQSEEHMQLRLAWRKSGLSRTISFPGEVSSDISDKNADAEQASFV